MGPFDTLWLAAAVGLATPLIMAAFGELVAERSGIINIGLEGMVLMGAFWSYWAAWLTGNAWLGVGVGMLGGAVLAVVMAEMSIRLRADQIVVGVGLNILALGVTTFAYRQIFAGQGQVLLGPMSKVAVPGLSELPVVGTAFFNQIPLVYVGYVIPPLVWWVLYRTTWGLQVRSVGEVPAAADTAGVGVATTRRAATVVAGLGGGLAGAFLSVGQLGFFTENMSAGRGFLALAAVIFGRWRPWGVLAACAVFGAADALQLRLQAEEHVPRQVWAAIALVVAVYLIKRIWDRRAALRPVGDVAPATVVVVIGIGLFFAAPAWSFPSQLWLAVPYLLTLLALAGVVGEARSPRALAIPYRRGGEVT